jgi:tetratricopeptide (TPR) repeat protein
MGSKGIITFLINRRKLLLLFFLIISFNIIFAESKEERAILDYTKAKYLIEEGEYGKAEKLYLKSFKVLNDPEILKDIIQLHINQNKVKKALRGINKYEKLFGDNIDILKLKAIIYYNKGNKVALMSAYNRLYNEMNYREAPFLTVYITMLLNDGKYNDAFGYINDNMNILPESFYFKNKALLFKEYGKFDSSFIYFDSLALLGDTFVIYANIGKAMLYEETNKPDSAIMIYENMPDNYFIKEKLVNLYYSKNEKQKLKNLLDTLLYINPNNARYWRYLGKINENMGHIQYAFSYYMTSISVDSSEYLSCFYLGNLHTLYKDLNNSLKWYKESVKRYPDFKEGYYHIILTEMQLNEFDSAFSYINRAVDKFTLNDTNYIYNLKGQVLYHKGEYEKAKGYLVKFTDQKIPLYLLADMLIIKGNRDSAAKMYEKIISIDSLDANAYNNLGYLLIEDKSDTTLIDSSEILIDKAISLEPNNPYFLDSKGYLLYLRGEYSSAIKYYYEALAKMKSGIIYYHIALIYFTNGNNKKAKEMLRNAIMFKNSEEITKKISELKRKL